VNANCRVEIKLGAKLQRFKPSGAYTCMRMPFAVLGLVACCCAVSQPNLDDRAPPPELNFVNEFVREMHEFQNLQDEAEKDLKHARNQSESLLAMVHWTTAVQIAARTDIGMLRDMKLSGDNQDSPKLLAEAHQDRIDLLEQMKGIAKKFLQGPEPGVDYSQLASDLTESRAKLERMNSTLVSGMAGLASFALLDVRHPDSQNHVSFLLITKKEKKQLVQSLGFTTGTASTNSPFQNAGGVLYDLLVKKSFKCADERQ
jgi:hypothetical protein